MGWDGMGEFIQVIFFHAMTRTLIAVYTHFNKQISVDLVDLVLASLSPSLLVLSRQNEYIAVEHASFSRPLPTSWTLNLLVTTLLIQFL